MSPRHNQLSLIDQTPEVPVSVGGASIEARSAASILTKASGFMADYDFTLNPYEGCSYGCSYCYAAFFARNRRASAEWGSWVTVKENALERLRSVRRDLRGTRIYVGSVTDPYQPVERRLGLVRQLLIELAARGARVVLQTRGPDVTRDIDVFQRFEHVRVNMTVTTDSHDVLRTFEPGCPSTDHRLRAIGRVAAAGVPTSITLTPLLPLADAGSFADRLLATGVTRFVVQPFHHGGGRFVAGTRPAALKLIEQYRWDDDAYRDAVKVLRARLPEVIEGRAGFAPD